MAEKEALEAVQARTMTEAKMEPDQREHLANIACRNHRRFCRNHPEQNQALRWSGQQDSNLLQVIDIVTGRSDKLRG
jgi:hypothetical protein